MDFAPPPTAADLLISLGIFAGIGLAFLMIACGARRAALRSGGPRSRVSAVVAAITVVIGVIWLAICGFAVLYPTHHNPLSRWLGVSLGLGTWFAGAAVLWFGWPRKASA